MNGKQDLRQLGRQELSLSRKMLTDSERHPIFVRARIAGNPSAFRAPHAAALGRLCFVDTILAAEVRFAVQRQVRTRGGAPDWSQPAPVVLAITFVVGVPAPTDEELTAAPRLNGLKGTAINPSPTRDPIDIVATMHRSDLVDVRSFCTRRADEVATQIIAVLDEEDRILGEPTGRWTQVPDDAMHFAPGGFVTVR